MTSEQARELVSEKGLTYEYNTESDICVLVILLNKHVKQANKAGTMSTNTMRMSQEINSKYSSNGTVKECCLFLNSHFFTQREAISFNPDGFIGFAGWADNRNKFPLINAFAEWIESIASWFVSLTKRLLIKNNQQSLSQSSCDIATVLANHPTINVQDWR